MTNAAIGAALAALALSGSAGVAKAAIEISGVTDLSTISYSVGSPAVTFTGAPSSGSSTQVSGPASGAKNGYGIYQANTTYHPSTINFSDNATSMGAYSSVTATTKLYLTITNTSATAMDVKLNSAITPAGFGFFVADPNTGDINQSVLTTNPNEAFSNFTPTTDGANLAGASYTFKITKGATASSAQTTVPNGFYFGSLTEDSSGLVTTYGHSNPQPNGIVNADPAADPNQFQGYQWDETDLVLDLGSLAANSSETITYTSSVSSFTNALSDGSGVQLLAYACFGDPIGKGGGSGADPSCSSSFRVGQPTIVDGVIEFNTPATVPEPASWALMLIGAGLVGGALRRRMHARLA